MKLNKLQLNNRIIICRQMDVVITQARETQQYLELTDLSELSALLKAIA